MLKVFEAFAGYGSQRMALRNLGIEHEVVAISEFDKYAGASYQAIHGETWNMGDITKIDVDEVPDHDLFTYSFPCQDISIAGNQKGFSKDSGTRSGLLWESERIIKAKKPKYLLMENVKNLIGKKFIDGFIEWTVALEELGYSNYYEVLNAKDFGVPQNRERVFMVSILGEHEPYVFPKPIKLEKRLKDVLEDEVDERYYLDDERAQQLIATISDVKDIEKQEGLKMNRHEVSGKSDIAQTLLARDYKGFGNQDMNGVIEPERILGIFDKENSTHQSGSVYNKDKIAPTLDTMQGGWRQPSIIEPHIPEPTVNKIDITQKVIVRKHKVDTRKLVQTLRSHKKTTNREIAEKLGRPITQVEHWFRTDDSFSIPDSDIWYELKGMLEIKTDEFDKPITEFIEEDGVYEKAERHYFTDGIAPTLTSASADEKIIERQPIIAASRGRNPENSSDRTKGAPTEQRLEVNDEGTSNALTTVEKDNYVVEPKTIDTIKLFDIPKEIVNDNERQRRVYSTEGASPAVLARTDSAKVLEGNPIKNSTEDDSKGVVEQYRIRKLTPLECFRLMGVTDEDFYKAQAVNSNSQLYKQAGNSIVVSVLEAIFRNMFLEVPDEDLIGEHIPLF